MSKIYYPLAPENVYVKPVLQNGLTDAEMKELELRNAAEQAARKAQAEAARAAKLTEFERTAIAALINIGEVLGPFVEWLYWAPNGQPKRTKVMDALAALQANIVRIRTLPLPPSKAPHRDARSDQGAGD